MLPRIFSKPNLYSSHKFLNNTNFKLFCSSFVTKIMGEPQGLLLAKIVTSLDDFAPTKTAESWDNVGLLIDPMSKDLISKILLTNDLTEDVMKEAVDKKVGMIISYHPPIFKGLKTITTKTWKERIVIQCLKNSIAVYSPHTSWDVKNGGPNDWFLKCLEPKSSEAILETGSGKLSSLRKPLSVSTAIQRIKKHINMPHLRLALAVGKDMDSEISTAAICVGSGVSVLSGVKADLYITGEMLHHDVLDATHLGTHVVLCNHSDSERGFMRYVAPVLQEEVFGNQVQVIMSEKDCDPLITV